MMEMKNSLEGLQKRFEQAEEKLFKLENSSVELIQSEEQKEKRMKKYEKNLRDLWDTISNSTKVGNFNNPLSIMGKIIRQISMETEDLTL